MTEAGTMRITEDLPAQGAQPMPAVAATRPQNLGEFMRAAPRRRRPASVAPDRSGGRALGY